MTNTSARSEVVPSQALIDGDLVTEERTSRANDPQAGDFDHLHRAEGPAEATPEAGAAEDCLVEAKHQSNDGTIGGLSI